MKMSSQTAHDILQQCGIPSDANFYTLDSAQVESLLEFADEYKYRKPKFANGSRGRYFYAYVRRGAAKS